MPNVKASLRKDCGRRLLQRCLEISYSEKVKEKGQQHAKLEEALRLYRYNVTSLIYISVAALGHNIMAAMTPYVC